jgi:ferredoxin-like protein FixX
VHALGEALILHNLVLRGGFYPASDEAGLEGVGTVLLVGNAGGAMWSAFGSHVERAPDPLNRWTKAVIEPVAARFGARALYPFGEPHWPFQRWAQRAETLHPSPIGLLIHPEFGLWHAYRAALLFPERLALPARIETRNPCAECKEKPCLSACPVGAFSGSGFAVGACGEYVANAEAECLSSGCQARNACPIGAEWRYPEAQIRFHMAAFARSVAPLQDSASKSSASSA